MTTEQTLRPRRCGDVRADGWVFLNYRKGKEYWVTEQRYRRYRMASCLSNARCSGHAFDLTLDHLLEIFPEDGLCPALKVPFTWHGGRSDTSPTLDRIVPERGYVRGNVQWLSDKANRIKSNATTAEICAVADYLKRLN